MQGKAALDRLISDVKSEYFPSNKEDAIHILRGGPLARARPALIRNFLILQLKDLLFGELRREEHQRRAAATRAVIDLHQNPSQAVLTEKVNSLFLSLEDRHLMSGVATIFRVAELRPFLHEDGQLRVRSYVASVVEDHFVRMFSAIVEVDFLAAEGIARLPNLSRETIAKLGVLKTLTPVPDLILRVVELYESSASFDQANDMAAAISNLVGRSDAAVAERIMRAATNGQVRHSGGFRRILAAIRSSRVLSTLEFNRILGQLELTVDYPDLLETAVAGADPTQQPFEVPGEVEALTSVTHPTALTQPPL